MTFQYLHLCPIVGSRRKASTNEEAFVLTGKRKVRAEAELPVSPSSNLASNWAEQEEEPVKTNKTGNRLTAKQTEEAPPQSLKIWVCYQPKCCSKARVGALQECLLSWQALCSNFHEGYLHTSSPDRITAFLEARIIVSFTFTSPATSSAHSFTIRQINYDAFSRKSVLISWHSSKTSAWVKVKIFIIRQICSFFFILAFILLRLYVHMVSIRLI